MIAKLRGKVDSVFADHLILDVSGVGYRVFASRRTLARTVGDIVLLIDTHVREDAFLLYGFWDATEQAWFRRLTAVQGVGARGALALLSALTPDDLALAIAAGDEGPLRRAEGVGPKLARRMITELKDKVPLPAMAFPSDSAPHESANAATAEAISALVHLGYGRAEAYGAVAKAQGETAQDLIRCALKVLSTRSA